MTEKMCVIECVGRINTTTHISHFAGQDRSFGPIRSQISLNCSYFSDDFYFWGGLVPDTSDTWIHSPPPNFPRSVAALSAPNPTHSSKPSLPSRYGPTSRPIPAQNRYRHRAPRQPLSILLLHNVLHYVIIKYIIT